MNHIHRVQDRCRDAQEQTQAYESGLRLLRAHLRSTKFIDVDLDGGRKDWIAVAGVLRWLDEIDARVRAVS